MNKLKQPSTIPCKSCGNLLTKGRVKYSNSDCCVSCDRTEKKAAIRIISGKNTYTELQFTDKETAQRYNNAMRRSGQSPGSGMKGQSKLR